MGSGFDWVGAGPWGVWVLGQGLTIKQSETVVVVLWVLQATPPGGVARTPIIILLKGSIGLFNDKTNGSPGRPFIPRNRLKFGKAARIMFSLLLTLLTAPKDILNHD